MTDRISTSGALHRPPAKVLDRSRKEHALPKGWRYVNFGDVVWDVNEVVRDPQKEGLERFVGLEHLDPNNVYIRRWGLLANSDVTFTKRLRAGQVLFGKRRAYQRKVALADFDAICSSDILTFEAKADQLIPELLPFIVQSEGFFQHAVGTSSGSLSPRTRWTQIRHYQFPLPSLDEQRRIASILWAGVEMSQSMSAAISAATNLRQVFVDDFAQRYVACHELSELDAAIEVGRPITYGILMPGLHFEGGIPVIKVRDFPDGRICEENLLLTSPEIELPYKRSRLKPGDLLVSIRGTIGRIAEVPVRLGGANITQDTARLSISPLHNRVYIRMMLESRFVQSQIRSRTTGLAVQGINIGELRRLKLPLPSRDEQDHVAAQLGAITNAESMARLNLEKAQSMTALLREGMLSGGQNVQ